mmetsp:Transcript_91859/g.154006  ORF Transcript_91859/g.154006 Transcript_91859/m.154006 type:complete len:122 (+) Transcript_91859:473-838(+)
MQSQGCMRHFFTVTLSSGHTFIPADKPVYVHVFNKFGRPCFPICKIERQQSTGATFQQTLSQRPWMAPVDFFWPFRVQTAQHVAFMFVLLGKAQCTSMCATFTISSDQVPSPAQGSCCGMA